MVRNAPHEIFRLLSDENRLRIICLLAREKFCVCVLSSVLGISQPAVSRHLARLREAGILKEEKDSFWTNYWIDAGRGGRGALFDRLLEWAEKDSLFAEDLKKAHMTDRSKCCIIPNGGKYGKKRRKKAKQKKERFPFKGV